MSQQTLLADLATWNREQCRSKLQEVLPKVIGQLDKAGCLGKEAEIIQLICHTFVPVITQQAHNLLFKVVHKTAECVESGLGEAKQTAAKVLQAGLSIQVATEKIVELMQLCVNLINCLTQCVNHFSSTDKQLEMASVEAIPASVLHVIEQSYSHCKESSQLYGELLASLSRELSLLFRQANGLQVAFIGLLDKVHLGKDCTEDDAQQMVIAIHGLFEITQVAAQLEVKVMLNLWKTISKLSCQHKAVLCDRLDLDQMITCLCADMSATYIYMFNVPTGKEKDNKSFAKSCKVLGFQMRMLHMFIKEFADKLAGTTMNNVYILILTLQSCIPPTLLSQYFKETLLDEVERQVTMGVSPLIKLLIPFREFAICVTQEDQDLSTNHQLPWLLTLLIILEQLPLCEPDTQNLWLDPVVYSEDIPRLNLFSAVFKATNLCYAELSSPIYMPLDMKDGQQQRMVSLNEMLATQISGFVACVASNHFHVVESALLQHVLGRCVLTAQLAVDVWCFMARYGTADLCRDHILLIAQLVHQGGLSCTPQCCHLVLLLRRLLCFMAVEHQQDFLTTYPAVSSTELWSIIPLTVFTPANLQPVVDKLLTTAIEQIHKWLGATKKSVGETSTLVTNLHILHNIGSNVDVMEKHINGAQRNDLVALCSSLWESVIFAPPGEKYPPVQAAMGTVYRLTNALVYYMEDSALIKVFLKAAQILTQNPTHSIKVLSLQFLKAITKKKFMAPNDNTYITNLPTVYRTLLLDDNVVIHQVALEVFARFAEETPHEAAVSATLKTDPSLQNLVVGFLSQNGQAPEMMSPDELQIQAECVELATNTPSTALYPKSSWPTQSTQPEDMDIDSPVVDLKAVQDKDMSLSDCIENIKCGLTGITKARCQGKLSDGIIEELKIIQMQLTELL